MKQEDITEELKARNQMEWVRRTNNVRSRVCIISSTRLLTLFVRVDEMILTEMVYV